jgi:pimeloyl-ACP methyl ester carboxylesterase
VLDLLTRLLTLEWRRSGATLRRVDVLGSHVYYAEFAPAGRGALTAALGRLPLVGGRFRRGSAPRRAPTVVLLHGLGASGASFFPVIGALRRGYRVVIPDLPGYGGSRPPAGRAFLSFAELVDVVEAFVEAVAPRGAYLAGNSLGGWLATKLAARRPELARGIALINPGGPALNAEDWVDFGRILTAPGAEAVAGLVGRLFHHPPLGARFLAKDLGRLFRAPSVLHLVATLRADDFVTEGDLERVDCPAVLIWGENDRLMPEGCRSFFLEKLPRVRHEPIPDCGHCPQLECPRRTAEILLDLPKLRRRRPRAPAGPAFRARVARDGAAAS